MNSESLEILSTSQVDKDMMRLKVLFPRNSHSLDLSRKSVDYAWNCHHPVYIFPSGPKNIVSVQSLAKT